MVVRRLQETLSCNVVCTSRKLSLKTLWKHPTKRYLTYLQRFYNVTEYQNVLLLAGIYFSSETCQIWTAYLPRQLWRKTKELSHSIFFSFGEPVEHHLDFYSFYHVPDHRHLEFFKKCCCLSIYLSTHVNATWRLRLWRYFNDVTSFCFHLWRYLLWRDVIINFTQ